MGKKGGGGQSRVVEDLFLGFDCSFAFFIVMNEFVFLFCRYQACKGE